MFNFSDYMNYYEELIKTHINVRMANLILDLKFGHIVDKGNKPYKGHCIRVAMKFANIISIHEIVAALLHDLFEDTDVQDDVLRANGFSERTIWLISMLTRNKKMTYNQNIINIVNTGDPYLILIKLADNIDNKNAHRLHYLPPDEFKFLDKRYAKAREILLEGISKHEAWKNCLPDLNPLDFE